MPASLPPEDEIARLRVENERLKRALEPFAHAAGFYEIESQSDPDAHILVKRQDGFASALRVKHFRSAREILGESSAR